MKLLPLSLCAATALTAFAALPGSAPAATGAYATGNVNMRTCGSTRCQRITTIPAGASVTIYGCSSGYGWCDTQWGRYRGWVSGNYLQAVAPGYSYAQPVPAIGALLGISILGAAIASAPYYNYPYYYPYRYGYRYPTYRGPYVRPPNVRWRTPMGRVSPGWSGPRGPNAPIRTR